MNRLFAFLVMLCLVNVSTAGAHGPTPQRVDESIAIAASPAAVWNAIKDFGAIGKWHPSVAEVKGASGNAPGAEREIVLKSGGSVTDGLDEYNDAERFYAYRLSKENLEAFPVSFYSSTLSVKASEDGKGSVVEWIGRFYRADTSNFPPEGKDDPAAVAAMTNFFKAGLENLKAQVEKGGKSKS